jgi:hypothetical protein
MGFSKLFAEVNQIMSSGRHSFKHNDAARLIRATAAAGFKVKGVALDAGKVTILVDDSAAKADDSNHKSNPWNEVLENASKQPS